MTVSLHQLLKTMVEKGGTDLHITTNSPPLIRVDGTLVTLSHPPMTAVDTKKLAYSVLTDAQKHRFEEHLELDISFGVKGLARFRANVFMQRGAVAGAFRSDSASSACRRQSRHCATNLAGWSSSPARPAPENRPPLRR
jgi:twitching motility protein PilT